MSDPSTSSPGGGRDGTEHPSGARPKERTNIQQLEPTGTPTTAGHVEHQKPEERTINENFDEIDTCLSAGNVDDLHVPISPPPAAQASTSPSVHKNALISADGCDMQDVIVRDNVVDCGNNYGVIVNIQNLPASSLDTGRAHASGARPKEQPAAKQLIDFVHDMYNNLPPPPPTPLLPPVEQPSPTVTADTELGSRVKEILNKRTGEYAVPRTVGKLKTPKTWINPETYEIDFFTSAVPEQEYKPELEFTQQKQKQEGKLIFPKDFFQNNDDGSPVRTVAVVGGAGYGKTEMLNRFALDVLDKKIPLLGEVEMVHLLRFRDFTEKGKLKPGKLFFGNTDLNDEGIIDPSVDYIRENPNKFLLVIDGADQYEDKEDKLGTESPATQYKEEYFTTDILNSLLSGKLFPDIRVLYSSREHTLRHFENGVRPHRVIALAGFRENDVETLIHELVGDKAEKIWEILINKSPGLLSSCSIPIYLNFTVSALLRNIDIRHRHLPETLTGVMMHVLDDLVQSNHIHVKGKIFEVIHALKAMSFLGTKAGKVTFTSSDLPDGIAENDYRDLIIPLVGRSGANQRLFDGKIKFVFIHQSLQEAISALYIADMEFSEFKNFVTKQLHTPQWVVVRRILCGILLNDTTFQIMRGIDPRSNLQKPGEREKKMEYLRQNLVSLLRKKAWWRPWYKERKGLEFVELLHAIHESGDGDVISSICEIDVQDLILTLTPSDWHVITSIISQAKNLQKVLLPKIHKKELATITKSLSSSNTKIPRIEEINLVESDHSRAGLAMLTEFSSPVSVQSLTLFSRILVTILNRSTHIDHPDLAQVHGEGSASLAAAMENPAEVERLSNRGINFYEVDRMNEQDFNNLATILNRCSHIDHLWLPELGLEDVTTLAPILKDSGFKIRDLFIWEVNVKESNLTDDDVSTLATVLSRCLQVVVLHLPALDANHLRTLASALKDSKLQYGWALDIGDENNKVPLQRETSLAICDFLSSAKFVGPLLSDVHLNYTASDEEINLIRSKTRGLRWQQKYDIIIFGEDEKRVKLK